MNWKLFRNHSGDPAVKVRTGNTQMTPQISVLALMAQDPASGIIQVEPGVYVTSELDTEARRHLLDFHAQMMRRFAVPLDEQDGYPGH